MTNFSVGKLLEVKDGEKVGLENGEIVQVIEVDSGYFNRVKVIDRLGNLRENTNTGGYYFNQLRFELYQEQDEFSYLDDNSVPEFSKGDVVIPVQSESYCTQCGLVAGEEYTIVGIRGGNVYITDSEDKLARNKFIQTNWFTHERFEKYVPETYDFEPDTSWITSKIQLEEDNLELESYDDGSSLLSINGELMDLTQGELTTLSHMVRTHLEYISDTIKKGEE